MPWPLLSAPPASIPRSSSAAVSMLLADMLRRVDVVAIVSGFLQKYLAGNPALPMILQLVDRIVKANEAEAKKKLYALALGSVFTIELGPLLTALLLAGRMYPRSWASNPATLALALPTPWPYPRLLSDGDTGARVPRVTVAARTRARCR